jgi:putative RecB family exonuclease
MLSIRRYDDLDDLEKLALIPISHSRMDTYSSCPTKYYFTYVQKEDRLFGAAATLGNIVHGVLEMSEELDLKEMVQILADQREKYDPDGQVDQKLLDAGWQMLVEYVDRHADMAQPNTIGREQEFNIVLGSAYINGFIDRIDREKGGLIKVTDYKTGAWEYRGKPRDNLQLGLYALAAADLYGVSEVYAELYYLRSGHRPGHLFVQEDLRDVASKVHRLVSAILEDRHFRPTDDEFTCQRLCDFGKSGVCKVGQGRLR